MRCAIAFVIGLVLSTFCTWGETPTPPVAEADCECTCASKCGAWEADVPYHFPIYFEETDNADQLDTGECHSSFGESWPDGPLSEVAYESSTVGSGCPGHKLCSNTSPRPELTAEFTRSITHDGTACYESGNIYHQWYPTLDGQIEGFYQLCCVDFEEPNISGEIRFWNYGRVRHKGTGICSGDTSYLWFTLESGYVVQQNEGTGCEPSSIAPDDPDPCSADLYWDEEEEVSAEFELVCACLETSHTVDYWFEAWHRVVNDNEMKLKVHSESKVMITTETIECQGADDA